MDGRGGCCLVRYTGDAEAASKVELIMLRYRPIAPKPATSPGGSPSSPSAATEPGESAGRAKAGSATARRRGRREGVGRRRRKARAPDPGEVAAQKREPPAGGLVTLPLLPETPVAAAAAAAAAASSPPPDLALSYPPARAGLYGGEGPGAVAEMAGSWLTLECVTETCEVLGEGRCTGAEARAALEGDACPAFLSDVSDRVAWTNAAYGRMVGSTGEGGEVAVALATGGRVPSGPAWCGFSCRVRVRCACGRGEKAWSLVAPCDVWRLAEDGWLAWRLDVKAALSLGR